MPEKELDKLIGVVRQAFTNTGKDITLLTKADDIIRFLDTGFYVMLWKNELGTYSAALVNRNELNILDKDALFDCNESQITDADTPSKALYELSQKIISR